MPGAGGGEDAAPHAAQDAGVPPDPGLRPGVGGLHGGRDAAARGVCELRVHGPHGAPAPRPALRLHGALGRRGRRPARGPRRAYDAAVHGQRLLGTRGLGARRSSRRRRGGAARGPAARILHARGVLRLGHRLGGAAAPAAAGRARVTAPGLVLRARARAALARAPPPRASRHRRRFAWACTRGGRGCSWQVPAFFLFGFSRVV
mmetsp:Transcript_56370/g.175255  ORF Transcript_56370/g.175255 Transcript_56370/m.175255 type:complete len:204 (-) Transcript_56370:28-639(-)